MVNEQWAWRNADKFACTFKPVHWGFALHVFDLCECPHTSMDYTVILGVPILPGPTLIEFLSALRSNCILYSDTMSLTFTHICKSTTAQNAQTINVVIPASWKRLLYTFRERDSSYTPITRVNGCSHTNVAPKHDGGLTPSTIGSHISELRGTKGCSDNQKVRITEKGHWFMA